MTSPTKKTEARRSHRDAKLKKKRHTELRNKTLKSKK